MKWIKTHRCHRTARVIADRHYNRQSVGHPNFVPPGRCLVFYQPVAVWVTSWPFAEYTKHEWAGAWVNSCFRRESGPIASEMIRDAVSATRFKYGDPPELGMVTFVDASKVKPKQQPGSCYLHSGFRQVGRTKSGLIALQMKPSDMPPPIPTINEEPTFQFAELNSEGESK